MKSFQISIILFCCIIYSPNSIGLFAAEGASAEEAAVGINQGSSIVQAASDQLSKMNTKIQGAQKASNVTRIILKKPMQFAGALVHIGTALFTIKSNTLMSVAEATYGFNVLYYEFWLNKTTTASLEECLQESLSILKADEAMIKDLKNEIDIANSANSSAISDIREAYNSTENLENCLQDLFIQIDEKMGGFDENFTQLMENNSILINDFNSLLAEYLPQAKNIIQIIEQLIEENEEYSDDRVEELKNYMKQIDLIKMKLLESKETIDTQFDLLRNFSNNIKSLDACIAQNKESISKYILDLKVRQESALRELNTTKEALSLAFDRASALQESNKQLQLYNAASNDRGRSEKIEAASNAVLCGVGAAFVCPSLILAPILAGAAHHVTINRLPESAVALAASATNRVFRAPSSLNQLQKFMYSDPLNKRKFTIITEFNCETSGVMGHVYAAGCNLYHYWAGTEYISTPSSQTLGKMIFKIEKTAPYIKAYEIEIEFDLRKKDTGYILIDDLERFGKNLSRAIEDKTILLEHALSFYFFLTQNKIPKRDGTLVTLINQNNSGILMGLLVEMLKNLPSERRQEILKKFQGYQGINPLAPIEDEKGEYLHLTCGASEEQEEINTSALVPKFLLEDD